MQANPSASVVELQIISDMLYAYVNMTCGSRFIFDVLMPYTSVIILEM